MESKEKTIGDLLVEARLIYDRMLELNAKFPHGYSKPEYIEIENFRFYFDDERKTQTIVNIKYDGPMAINQKIVIKK